MPRVDAVLNVISLLVPLLLLIPFTSAIAEDTEPATQESKPLFKLQRELTQLDAERKQLESERNNLNSTLHALPSESDLNQFKFDPNLFAKLDTIKSRVDDWLSLVKRIRAVAPTNLEYEQLPEQKKKEIEPLLRQRDEDLDRLLNNADEIDHLAQVEFRKARFLLVPPTSRNISELIQNMIDRNTVENIREQVSSVERITYRVRDSLERGNTRDISDLSSKVVPNLIKKIKDVKPKILAAAQAFRQKVENKRDEIEVQLADLHKRQDVLEKQIGKRLEGQVRIDERLITYALPAFGIVLILLIALPALYKKEAQGLILGSGLVLEMTTVFLLTVTILLLGIGGKLKPEVLGTLIGGISGYVLGRWRRVTPESTDSETSNTSPQKLTSEAQRTRSSTRKRRTGRS
jgi:cell division protein FtsB